MVKSSSFFSMLTLTGLLLLLSVILTDVQAASVSVTSHLSQHCLGVVGASNAAGANVAQYDCASIESGNWRLRSVGSDTYEIANTDSGLCLDVYNGSTSNGGNVQQWNCNNTGAQRWKSRSRGGSLFELVNTNSNKCLDVAGRNTSSGANILIWDCHGGSNQTWDIPATAFNSTVGEALNATGRWGRVLDWPLVAVSMANLPDGRLLTYSGSERRTWPRSERTYSATWDPATGLFDETQHIGHNMFCGSMSMTEEGQVFVNGGRNGTNSPWTSLYNFESSSWEQIESMPGGGRWYPTTLALGNGSILTAMGNSTNVKNPDLWSSTSGWRILNGIDFISMRQRRNQLGRENLFPLLSQAPDGSIFHFWDTVENHHISTTGNGSAVRANPNTDSHSHAGGNQVMFDEGKLLISGNNDGSWGGNSSAVSDAAFTVDLNQGTPVIRSTSRMHYRRKFHQMITLPTGEVLVVGGNSTGEKFRDSGSVYFSEIWNPQSGTWRLTAPLSVPRDYHSTALLMTDGRVITAGGGYHPNDANSSGTHQNAQIYSPPYLFDADGQMTSRPTIEVEFNEVSYGQNFSVATSDDIEFFSLIKLSATTHAVNTDARFFKPQFTAIGNSRYSITMHDNPNVATPGYWMLFAIDAQGVPSIAEVIKIVSEPIDPNNGEPPVINDIDSSPVQINQSTSYSVTAAGLGLEYSWNFGDGSGDSAFSVQSSSAHTYRQPGRYVIAVTARTPAGRQVTETFTQLVHGVLTPSRPMASGGLIEIPARAEVWNVNPDNNSVGIIDTDGLTRKAVVNVGANPRALALAPDGRIWVVNKDDATISIISSTTRAIVQTIVLDQNSRPHGIVFNGHSAYVALEGNGTVVQLNQSDGSERRRVYGGWFPRHLSINSAGNRLYVSGFITPPLPGESGRNPVIDDNGGQVLVYSTTAGSLNPVQAITLNHINRAISESQGPGLPNYLGPAVIAPDGQSAWVPSKQDNILAGQARGGAGMTFDQTVRAITSRLDLSSGTESLYSRVDHDNASVASHAAFGPFGLTLFTALEGNRQVSLIDTSNNVEYARFDVGRAPQSLLLSKDGRRLYVHNFMDRTVSAYDVAFVVNQGGTEVSELASVSVSNGERLPDSVFRGKQFFYDARDDRLAALDYMSCASCHNEGGHDGRTWDFTGLGEGLRNTISLKGPGGTAHGLMHWSANFDEGQDFEGQIRSFAGGTGFLSNAEFLTGTRSDPLGDSKAGVNSDLDALAAYLTSLDTPLPSPYRSEDGQLTTQAETGRVLFVSQNCMSCHTGDTTTDSNDPPLLHDIGTLDADSGERLSESLTGIDTPTLLGAWHTAPYLHDGSAATLEQAINAHDGIDLSDTELSALANFVAQIESGDLDGVSFGTDTDGDGIADVDDPDDDNDGFADSIDVFPLDASEWLDSDGDGVGDNADIDAGGSCNLLENGSLDTNTVGWATDTTLSIVSDAVAGEGAMAWGAGVASVAFNASANISYTFSGFTKSPSTPGWAGLGIDFLDAAGDEVDEIFESISPTENYTQISLSKIAPAGTTSARLWIYAEDTRTLQVDELDIRVTGCVSGGGSNQPPVITHPGEQNYNVADVVNVSITATDPEGSTLRYSANDLPAGLTMNATIGVISGSPTVVGDRTVVVTVSDGELENSIAINWRVQSQTIGSCNLLDNGSLDTTTAGWATNTTLSIVSNAVAGGGAMTWAAGWASTVFDARADTSYVFTGFVRSPNTVGWAGLGIDFLDGAGNELGEIFRSVPPVESFTEITLNKQSPPGTVFARLWFYTEPTRSLHIDELDIRVADCTVGGGSNQSAAIVDPGNQTHAVDDVINLGITASNSQGAVLQFTASGLPDGLQINAATGVIDGIATTEGEHEVTVTISDGVLQSSANFSWIILPQGGSSNTCNLLTNGDFETGTDGWFSNTALQLTSDATTGLQALQYTGGTISTQVPVQPGSVYTFNGDYKSEGSTGWTGFGIDYLDANGQELSEEVMPLQPTSAYSNATLTGTVPVNATSLQLWIFAPATLNLTLDDLQLRDVACEF